MTLTSDPGCSSPVSAPSAPDHGLQSAQSTPPVDFGRPPPCPLPVTLTLPTPLSQPPTDIYPPVPGPFPINFGRPPATLSPPDISGPSSAPLLHFTVTPPLEPTESYRPPSPTTVHQARLPINFGRPPPAQCKPTPDHPPVDFGRTSIALPPINFGHPPVIRTPINFGHPPAASTPVNFGRPPTIPPPVNFGRPPPTVPRPTSPPPTPLGPSPSVPPPVNFGRPPLAPPQVPSRSTPQAPSSIPVHNPSGRPIGWTALQTRLIEASLRLLMPRAPFPPFSPQAATNVNELIRCRQWLLHTGASLLDPHEGHHEAWLHFMTSADEFGLGPESYRITPGWDLYTALSSVAEGSYPAGPATQPCAGSNGALMAAKGEIFASLESAMASFKILHTRDRLFCRALEDYDDIIHDLEYDVL